MIFLLDPAYGRFLGYTYEEIESCFSEFICRACTVLGMEREKLLEELTKNYGGFCFDEKAESKVFAPWSILSFFLSPQLGFKPYWIESGFQSSTLMQYLKSHSLRNCGECGNDKTLLLSSLCGSSDYDSISDLALLTQAGYLTIKAVKYTDIVYLDYPNLEARGGLSKLQSADKQKRGAKILS